MLLYNDHPMVVSNERPGFIKEFVTIPEGISIKRLYWRISLQIKYSQNVTKAYVYAFRQIGFVVFMNMGLEARLRTIKA